jgi:hypothetical protein
MAEMAIDEVCVTCEREIRLTRVGAGLELELACDCGVISVLAA